MTANLGTWEIRTSPSNPTRDGCTREYRIVRLSREVIVSEPELEDTVGDFITRQVLERDSVFFEG